MCGLECGNVDFLALFHPLHEGTETSGRNKNVFRFSRCRVHEGALLEIGHLATFGFDVAMAHVIAGERGFSGDGADF